MNLINNYFEIYWVLLKILRFRENVQVFHSSLINFTIHVSLQAQKVSLLSNKSKRNRRKNDTWKEGRQFWRSKGAKVTILELQARKTSLKIVT